MTTCSTCKHWLPKKTDPAMARHRMAICEHGPRWAFLPPQATCERHLTADAQTLEKRRSWLDKPRAAAARETPAEGTTA